MTTSLVSERVWRWQVWERDVRAFDSSWFCAITVEMADGTLWHRTGIKLWDSPIGYEYHNAEREPPCIDCRWSLHEGALWVDRSSCDDVDALWQKQYSFYR
jgi:hypothetical protein